MARAEQMWATAPNLQFLIRRGLTPLQAYITFHALGVQRDPWAGSLQYGVLLVAYQIFLLLLPYGIVLPIVATSVLFVLLIGQNIFLRRSRTGVLNRVVGALAESLVIFIDPVSKASYNFFPGEHGEVMKKLTSKELKLRKLAFQVAEGLAVLDDSPRREAGESNYSDCARVILWGADRIWDQRRVAQAVDTIIEQLKHILGPNPHIPLRFAVRNDFPEFPPRSQQRWVNLLDKPLVKIVAAPFLITIIGACIAAFIRVFFG
ncbi:MAG: hypothetical protein WCB73_06360 [Pseudonocardiaceae bacterium]